MIEAEWLSCADPKAMLEFLQGKASDRKLRLFAVACCRAVWPWMSNERFRRGVELMEAHAETAFPEDQLESLQQEVAEAHNAISNREPGWNEPDYLAASMAVDAVWYAPDLAADRILAKYIHAVKLMLGERYEAAFVGRVLLELFGNPFRPSPPLPHSVLAWNDWAVRRIAEDIYDTSRLPDGTPDNARLLILADALEDAGCTDSTILDHLRGPGPHVRGCFVLDHLLAKG
jgi:hypothetical protein